MPPKKTGKQLDQEIAEAMRGRRRKYVGQCDLVRRKSASNEEKWHAMMNCAEPVTRETFLANVDISDLLEDDESEREWVAYHQRQDPSTGFYRSWWGPDRAWFIQTAGFEYIFLD